MSVLAAMCENGCTTGDGIALFGISIAVAAVLIVAIIHLDW